MYYKFWLLAGSLSGWFSWTPMVKGAIIEQRMKDQVLLSQPIQQRLIQETGISNSLFAIDSAAKLREATVSAGQALLVANAKASPNQSKSTKELLDEIHTNITRVKQQLQQKFDQITVDYLQNNKDALEKGQAVNFAPESFEVRYSFLKRFGMLVRVNVDSDLQLDPAIQQAIPNQVAIYQYVPEDYNLLREIKKSLAIMLVPSLRNFEADTETAKKHSLGFSLSQIYERECVPQQWKVTQLSPSIRMLLCGKSKGSDGGGLVILMRNVVIPDESIFISNREVILSYVFNGPEFAVNQPKTFWLTAQELTKLGTKLEEILVCYPTILENMSMEERHQCQVLVSLYGHD